MEQSVFEEKIKPVLNYIGIIGASLAAVAYIIIVFVLINGFKVEDILTTTVFAVVNVAIGFIIMQFLKVQGIAFAKELPKNKEIIERYYMTKTKDKKQHSIKYYWATTIVKDVFIKCITLGASTIGVVYVMIEGNHDYTLILLAVVNLILFVCFGLLSLVSAYDYFNNMHIPFILDKSKEKEEEDKCLNTEIKSFEIYKNKSEKTKMTSLD